MINKFPGFKVTEVFVFIATEIDGSEGVVAFGAPDGRVYPLVCADRARLEQFRPIAAGISKETGRPIVVAHFTVRRNIEEIAPQ